MSTDAALERIAEKLRRAREQGARPSGVEAHGMRLEPPVLPETMAAAEAMIGVELPEEYRAFVMRLGNGGAGPAYGMYSLSVALHESEIDVDPGLLRAPFPHVEYYNPATDPEVIAFWRRMDAVGGNDEEEELHVARERSGALVLCHEGCGHEHFLVVAGPARGTMWIDSRGSDQGFIPLNATFLEWYERWVDDVLAGGRGSWWFGPPVYPSG